MPKETKGTIDEVREARNKAAHEVGHIDQATVEDIVEKARQILGSIREDPPTDTSILYPSPMLVLTAQGTGLERLLPLERGC